jgi:hypothetical protein
LAGSHREISDKLCARASATTTSIVTAATVVCATTVATTAGECVYNNGVNA